MVCLWVSWVLALVVWSRDHLLDDSLIHLRIAENLRDRGRAQYHPGEVGFGSSSPGYVLLLAALSSPAVRSPLVAKGASVAAYLLLISLIALLAARFRGLRQGVALAFLLCLSGPFAIRWLCDGMETSLHLLLTTLLVALTASLCFGRLSAGGIPFLGLFALACASVLVRVESVVPVLCCMLAIFLEPERRLSGADRLLALAAPGMGSFLAISWTWALTGALLPDTAVAKTLGAMPIGAAMAYTARTLVAAGTFGAGSAVVWAASFLVAARNAPRKLRLLLLPNCLPVALVLLIAFRGQALHGARHVVWVFVFLVFWNLLLLPTSQSQGKPMALSGSCRWFQGERQFVAALGFFASVFLVELWLVAPAIVTRSQLLQRMSQQGLRALEGRVGIAADIGFVGYFTRAKIRDLHGLVNGPEVARMSPSAREEWAFLVRPDFIYLEEGMRQALTRRLKDLELVEIARYPIANVTHVMEYGLAVRPELFQQLAQPASRQPIGSRGGNGG